MIRDVIMGWFGYVDLIDRVYVEIFVGFGMCSDFFA